MKKTIVSTVGASAPLGPYSQGVLVEGGRTLYISGQIPAHKWGQIFPLDN